MPDRTKETSLNTKLAEYLRREGFDAVEEQTLRGPNATRPVIDILVDLDSFAIAIEAEFAPKNGREDAQSRLTTPELQWRGLPIRSVYALTYPVALQGQSPAKSYRELKTTSELVFSHRFHPNMAWREDVDIPHSHDWSSELTGSVGDLAEVLRTYWMKVDSGSNIDSVVKLASDAISQASESLNRIPQIGERGSDPASTKALIWLNALLFQELLAARLQPKHLPKQYRTIGIPRPRFSDGVIALLDQWRTILKINWWPIFHVAHESLEATPSEIAVLAIGTLKRVAKQIAEQRVTERHDVAGRIFHRLLESRKFLATNYTTIPSAIVLAGLAFDDSHELWRSKDFTDITTLRNLKIVDPACGSGTLLMAAAQEIMKRSRRSDASRSGKLTSESELHSKVIKTLLEESLYGFDVVPAAIHLAASTLSMAETRQVISKVNLWRMRHGIYDHRARLGSLDMLSTSDTRGNASRLALFQDSEDAHLVRGGGEQQVNIRFPQQCDLIIANPPYTRAGGPGSAQNTAWNPIFGSLMHQSDQRRMNDSLKRTLRPTPAGLYSGLGSAFLVLANENIRVGGRIAFVLPSAAITGSSWLKIRQLLLKHYRLDWIVTSHDPRQRTGQASLPGRIYSSFSESTTISEVLLIATRIENPDSTHLVKFINLRKNLTEILDAITLTRCMLTLQPGDREIVMGDQSWGEIRFVPQGSLSEQSWIFNAFVQSRVLDVADLLLRENLLANQKVPLALLSESWKLGPYEMQIKNPKQGLFKCDDRPDFSRPGFPALWHHKANHITTLQVSANAWLTPKPSVSVQEYQQMLDRGSRLHIARELRHNTQRIAAVMTDQTMLGVRSWISLVPVSPRSGDQEVLCLWLNSTPGMLLRIVHANRPYPGRSLITHTDGRTFPVLDVKALTSEQLLAGRLAFRDLHDKCLQSVDSMSQDSVRKSVDASVARILGFEIEPESRDGKVSHGLDYLSAVRQLSESLSREPIVSLARFSSNLTDS